MIVTTAVYDTPTAGASEAGSPNRATTRNPNPSLARTDNDRATVDARARAAPLRCVPYDGPIPLDALRDLIALTRALYVTFKGMGQGYDTQLSALPAIGAKLPRALAKAREGGPGTWPHRTAWLLAEEATQALGEAVDVYLPAKALITASGERLLKKR